LKRFVKQPGGADLYQNLTVTFIRGRAPVLIITDDDGAPQRRIDIAQYTTKESLHRLFDHERFATIKRDTRTDCRTWAQRGDCKQRSAYMLSTCPLSCAKLEL
jgi:hypothetical protein